MRAFPTQATIQLRGLLEGCGALLQVSAAPVKNPLHSGNVLPYFFLHLGLLFLLCLVFALPMEALLTHFSMEAKFPMLESKSLIFLLVIIFFGPILEEFAFRYPLSLNKNHLYLSGVISGIFILTLESLAAQLAVAISYSVALVVAFRIHKLHIRSQMIPILVSTLCFGVVHVDNYEYPDPWLFALLAPLIISPQIFVGYVCALLRTHQFRYSILFHVTWNVLAVGLWWLFE